MNTPTVTKTYTYNDRNMLASEALSTGKSTAYAYDARGNRTSKTVTENNTNVVTSYVYDGLNRLTSESTSDSAGLTARTYYVYDADGNMTLRSRESFDAASDTDVPAVTISNGFSNVPNIDTFEYNDFGELTSAKVNGVMSTYTYRADGLRWYKTVNGTVTRHLWDGDDVIMDMTDAYAVTNKYTRGLGLIRYTDGTNTKYYTRNRHGDTNHMIDAATYSIANTYKYDAYGNQESISSTDTNPFRYSGEYFDSETGLIYLRARYYDSAIGRFISEDPVRDGTNWFVYCANNPVMLHDPSGLKLVIIEKDEQDVLELFNMIQETTDHVLTYEEFRDDLGNFWYYDISIVKKAGLDSKRWDGNSLVYQLINTTHITQVRYMLDSEATNYENEGNLGAFFVPGKDVRKVSMKGIGAAGLIKIRRYSDIVKYAEENGGWEAACEKFGTSVVQKDDTVKKRNSTNVHNYGARNDTCSSCGERYIR